MSPYDDKDQGCHDHNCASDVWKDGYLACMCFYQGNASWCDGTKSAYYDNYYKRNGKNPFGDSNQDNRKYNTNISQLDASCRWDWECESGRECYLILGGEILYYSFLGSLNVYTNTSIRILSIKCYQLSFYL